MLDINLALTKTSLVLCDRRAILPRVLCSATASQSHALVASLFAPAKPHRGRTCGPVSLSPWLTRSWLMTSGQVRKIVKTGERPSDVWWTWRCLTCEASVMLNVLCRCLPFAFFEPDATLKEVQLLGHGARDGRKKILVGIWGITFLCSNGK